MVVEFGLERKIRCGFADCVWWHWELAVVQLIVLEAQADCHSAAMNDFAPETRLAPDGCSYFRPWPDCPQSQGDSQQVSDHRD